jgi:hypothetical protein
VLSQQFAGQGLQFFKVNKTITHVTIARPQFLNLETTPVSEGVKRIVEFINAHPKCSRRNLFEALAPSPAVVAVPSADAAAGSPAPAEAAGPTPEQTTVISDLHWLVHQGHVIEFANGMLDTAKKPLPKPPKPEKKTAEQPAETVSTTEPIAPAEIAAATPEAEQTTLATAAPVEVPESTEPPPENSTAEATSVQSETSTVAAPEVAAEKPSE